MSKKQKIFGVISFLIIALTVTFVLLRGHPQYQYDAKKYQLENGQLNETRLTDFLADLSTIQRHDEGGLEKARKYITSVLEEDYEVTIQEYDYSYGTAYQNMSYIRSYQGEGLLDKEYYQISDKDNNKKGYNIIVSNHSETQMQEDTLILSAHYDTTYKSFGAYDNASGVAALLEIAKVISKIETDVNVCFVFFSHEELGLIGSRHFVSQLNQEQMEHIIGNINIDCIGEKSSGDLVLYTCSGLPNQMTRRFPESIEIRRLINSDHSSFSGIGVDAVWISQQNIFQSHANSMKDVYDDINIDLYHQTVDLVLQQLIQP